MGTCLTYILYLHRFEQSVPQVDIEAEVDGWLHCVNRYGVRGLVPASYIRILEADEGPADITTQLFGGYSVAQVSTSSAQRHTSHAYALAP